MLPSMLDDMSFKAACRAAMASASLATVDEPRGLAVTDASNRCIACFKASTSVWSAFPSTTMDTCARTTTTRRKLEGYSRGGGDISGAICSKGALSVGKTTRRFFGVIYMYFGVAWFGAFFGEVKRAKRRGRGVKAIYSVIWRIFRWD